MEILYEIIFELILEGVLEVAFSKRISRWIRFPLLFLIAVFFITVIGLCIFAGVKTISDSFLASIFLIAVGLFLLIGCVRKLCKFRRV